MGLSFTVVHPVTSSCLHLHVGEGVCVYVYMCVRMARVKFSIQVEDGDKFSKCILHPSWAHTSPEEVASLSHIPAEAHRKWNLVNLQTPSGKCLAPRWMHR